MPVGIMINGLVDFENIPLETLIGEFSNEIKNFENIEKIKNDFIKFLSKNTPFTSSEEYIKSLLKPFKKRLNDLIDEDGFERAINNKSSKKIPDFVKKFSSYNNEFYSIIPQNYDKKTYNSKIWRIFSNELTYEGTGIIIAGFDKNHHYPTFFVLNLYCNDAGKIIYEEIESVINCENPLIRVFAMNEEAYSFISGVSDDFEISIKNFISDNFSNITANLEWYLENEKMEYKDQIVSALKTELNSFYDDLTQYIQEFKFDMIEDTSYSCEILPRQILCDLANSLIELTALKQKISLDLETVSKESDILLITKANNINWVKYNEEII